MTPPIASVDSPSRPTGKRAGVARVYRGTPRNVARLARVLREGGLVAVPTETVYGLAANALDAKACRAIFRAKRRPATDPLIVHVHSLAQVDALAELNDSARKLAKAFWPGPLTIVLPKKPTVPDVVSSGRPSVAVRMPRHPLFRALLKACDLPLAAPSANPFGYVSPTSAEHVLASLGSRVGHILDGGPAAIGLESTIVDLRDPKTPRLLRPGAITRAQLERVLRRSVAVPPRAARAGGAQLAPGLLARHYSPRTPAVLHDRIRAADVAHSPSTDAWLLLAPRADLPAANVFYLDERGDLRGAARRLFGLLRALDGGGYTRLHFECARGDGLADAINERLSRAAARGR